MQLGFTTDPNFQPLDNAHGGQTTKKSPTDFSVGLSIKEGSYLLSRIALQYHRRNRA